MAEFIARLFLSFAIVCVATPIACFFCTPYVLLRPMFLEVENRRYWREVRNGYGQVIQGCIEWGNIWL